MENIFVIGGKVEGKSFIGRDSYIRKFKQAYFEKKCKTSKAIVGLTRIGKSSLALNVFKDIPKDVIYIYKNLKEYSTYRELWQDICDSVSEYLKKEDLLSQEIIDDLVIIGNNDIPWIKFMTAIKRIFQLLEELEIKVIMVLDEFDYATNLFNSETCHWELFRTIFSEPKYSVSPMTISRRNLHTIEGKTPQSSTFRGIFDIIYFKGFDDDDMEKYYQVFEDMEIKLDDKQREEIEYYCGRLPFLLSIMGHYIVESVEENGNVDITKIFIEKCKTINDHYKDCIEHLRRDDDLRRLIPFVIGPNIGVTKFDRDELINLGYLKEENGKIIAISKYFSSFLSVNEINLDIWKNIITLEKKIKNLIYNDITSIIDFLKISGYNLNHIQNNILEKIDGITSSDISRYKGFIASNLKDFNRNSSFFDVMSLTDSFKIIRHCWSIFSKYFNNDTYNNWENKFDKCAKARNPVAHGHEEYLSEADCNEIDIYCKQIFEFLANVNSSPVSEKDILKVACKNMIFENKLDYSLLHKTVDFLVTEIKNGTNLVGIVENKYRGTIQKNTLQNIENLDDMIFTTVKVILEKIDSDHYLCKYVKK